MSAQTGTGSWMPESTRHLQPRKSEWNTTHVYHFSELYITVIPSSANTHDAHVLGEALNAFEPGSEIGRMFTDSFKIQLQKACPAFLPKLHGALGPNTDDDSDE